MPSPIKTSLGTVQNTETELSMNLHCAQEKASTRALFLLKVLTMLIRRLNMVSRCEDACPQILYIITDSISTRYRVLYRPRHCDLVTQDGDDVTMVMEYWGARGGRGAEVERAVALRLGKGQTINDVQVLFSSYPVLTSIMTIL